MTRFKNPSNGYVHEVNSISVFLGCLLLGSLFFLLVGEFAHSLISAILAILTFGLSWLIYPFFAPGIIRRKWLRKGFIELDEYGSRKA